MNKKHSYNTLSFVIFTMLLVGAFSFFTFADDTQLTLFEDFDRDGISNAEEKMLGTDPKDADSDGDGYSDGVEVESGYDPLIAAPGDKIIKLSNTENIQPLKIADENITEKISKDVVSFLEDAQEEGKEDISSEEISEVVAKSVTDEVEFIELPSVEIDEISIKEQDYDNLSNKAYTEQMREDAITYFTTISYIFVSNFPQGFFERSPDEFMNDIMGYVNNYSSSLTDYSFFEDLAENALAAENQLNDVDVPEDLVELHAEGIELMRGASALYKAGDYKKVSTDIAPVIASLAQLQGLIMLGLDFQEHIEQKVTEYELEDIFLEDMPILYF